MRVITGSAKGRRLESPIGDNVRPTTDRVKEALFSSIQFDIEGRKVLDLFAGSGQLGIEALSRGAASAVFVDNNAESLTIINRNLSITGLLNKAKVIKSDSEVFLKTSAEKFDIIFLDPPYNKGLLATLLPGISAVASESAVIICEHPLDVELPNGVGNFNLIKTAKYGKICVSTYRK